MKKEFSILVCAGNEKKGLTNAFLQQAATAAGCTKLKALTSCSLTFLIEQNLFSKCIMPTDIRGLICMIV